MIVFNSGSKEHEIQLGRLPNLYIGKIVFVTNDETWTSKLSAASLTVQFECKSKNISSSSNLDFISFVSLTQRQPVLEVNKLYTHLNQNLEQDTSECDKWMVKIALNNLVLSETEAINISFPEIDELLRLENLFIKLKEQGRSLDEVSSILKVDLDLVKNWDSSLTAATDNIPKNSPLTVTIDSKGIDGKYLYSQKLNFRMSVLEKIKFDLWQAFSISEEKINSSSDPKGFKELSEKAKWAHGIFSKYFVDVKLKESSDKDVNVTYNLNTDQEEAMKDANEAIGFYINKIYSMHRHAKNTTIISSPSKDIYSDKNKILPICIKQFYIKNFHSIKEIYLQSIPVDNNWLFITGENGFGKTLVLRAITIGLFGDRDNDLILTNELQSTINLEYSYFGQNLINNIWTSKNFNSLKEMCCYGPNRLNVSSNESNNETERKNSITYNLFNNDGRLLNIENELLITYFSDKYKFDQYKEIFRRLIPSISFIMIEERERKVYYIEKDIDTNESYKIGVSFEQLASGAKSLIAMVGDMILRLSRNQTQISKFSDLCGIVIIDELDLHWHPKWQREIPRILSELFPRIQFIATTHSEIPLLGAPRNSTFFKVERSNKDGITMRKVQLEIENLLPNTVLTSPMFDMDHITSVTNINSDDIRTEDKYDDIEKGNEEEKLIDDFEKGNQEFPDDLFTKLK